MKELFLEKTFRAGTLKLIGTCNAIIEEYLDAGYDLSLRQLYYQLVSRNIVPNTEESYKSVGSAVSDGRLAGLIDWEALKDRGRSTTQRTHWDSPEQILRASADSFARDLWADQPFHVEVMVEKQALEGVIGARLPQFGRSVHGEQRLLVVLHDVRGRQTPAAQTDPEVRQGEKHCDPLPGGPRPQRNRYDTRRRGQAHTVFGGCA